MFRRLILCCFIFNSTFSNEEFKEQVNIVCTPETLHFIQDFPCNNYKLHKNPQGWFWIDQSDVIKDYICRGDAWEPELEVAISKYTKPGTIALDIGSHIGTHIGSMANAVGPNGRVFAFEPQIDIFRELVMNMKMNHFNHVTCIHTALGAQNQIITLGPRIKGNAGSRFIGNGVEKVSMRTLDSFNFENVSFIKIDVENYEEEVLRGARETIMRNRPIMIIELQGNIYIRQAKETTNAKKQQVIQMLTQEYNYEVKHLHQDDVIAFPR